MHAEGTPGLLDFAARLFDQQMWCWGQDVKRPDNLLLRYGFECWRPPEDIPGAGYALRRESRRQVVLWGFGLFHGNFELGGMFVRRFGFHPLFTEAHDLPVAFWKPGSMPSFRLPEGPPEQHRLSALLSDVCAWVADYEAWVCAAGGAGYREECVARWRDPFLAADRMERSWRRLAEIAAEVVASASVSDSAAARGFPVLGKLRPEESGPRDPEDPGQYHARLG